MQTGDTEPPPYVTTAPQTEVLLGHDPPQQGAGQRAPCKTPRASSPVAGRVPCHGRCPQSTAQRYLLKLTMAWMRWPYEDWANILASFLTGEAQRAYHTLPEDQASDYHILRKEVLIRHGSPGRHAFSNDAEFGREQKCYGTVGIRS